jgi:hypothetical protein
MQDQKNMSREYGNWDKLYKIAPASPETHFALFTDIVRNLQCSLTAENICCDRWNIK